MMDHVLDRGETARIRARLLFFAWRWYRIPREIAVDLVQVALVSYLEVRERYPSKEEHARIIVGIFRNKCREYIGNDVRETRNRRLLRTEAAAGNAVRQEKNVRRIARRTRRIAPKISQKN